MTRRQWMWLWIWLLLFLIIFCVWNKLQMMKNQQSPQTATAAAVTQKTEQEKPKNDIIIQKDISIKLLKEGDIIKVSGVFPSKAALEKVLKAMSERGLKVQQGAVIIDKHADNQKLLNALPTLAEKLNRFENGSLEYLEKEITIKGTAPDENIQTDLLHNAGSIDNNYHVENMSLTSNKNDTNKPQIVVPQTVVSQDKTNEVQAAKTQPQASEESLKEKQKDAKLAQQELDAALKNKRVEFVYAKDKLTKKSQKIVDQVAAILKKHPAVRIEIAGHTDSDGTAERNLKLSQRRANAVKKYLISKGIDPKRLVAKGYGESKPLVKNDTAAHKQLNRRVEFKVIK